MTEILYIVLIFISDNIINIIDTFSIIFVMFLVKLIYFLMKGLLYNTEHDIGLLQNNKRFRFGRIIGSTKAFRLVSAIKVCAENISTCIYMLLFLKWMMIFITFADTTVMATETATQEILFFLKMSIHTFVWYGGIICLLFLGLWGAVLEGNLEINKCDIGDSAHIIFLLNKAKSNIALSKVEIDYLKSREEVTFADVDSIPFTVVLLENIKKMSFFNTNVSSLPDTIIGLQNLECLDLEGTNIEEFPLCITKLKKLKKLSLNRLKMKSLPDEIGKMENLEFLDVRDTCLFELPASICSLKSLRELWIAGTLGDCLPCSVEVCRRIKKLILDSCQVVTMGERQMFRDFCSLEELYIMDKINWKYDIPGIPNVKVLPEGLGKLKNLRKLIVYGVERYAIPDSIGNLSKLKVASFCHSGIYYLPDSFTNLEQLEELWLQDSKIHRLPERFDKLGSLKKLDLSFTPLTVLPESIGKLKNLFWLDLSYLKLEEIPRSILDLGLKFDVRHVHRILLKKSDIELISYMAYFWEHSIWHKIPSRRYKKAGIYMWNTCVQFPPLSVMKKGRKRIIRYYLKNQKLQTTSSCNPYEINVPIIIDNQNHNSRNNVFGGVNYMANTINNYIAQQVGNQGPRAGENSKIYMNYNNDRMEYDYEKLEDELVQIKKYLKSKPESDENDILIGQITSASQKIKKKTIEKQ